ncbi:MAG: FAD-dependent oxidoreductase [Gammaproteobacteria bacterium]|nr:FAD-dependent oxidoreductase [Gammaproteobacteria bacterium]
MTESSPKDVVIIGGGVSGTALLHTLARYTDLKNITLTEKYASLASLNSHGRNNSQTLHCGDIETNYSLEKAIQVKSAAAMLERYASAHSARDRLMRRYPKMVLGVGRDECDSLRARFEKFSPHFPTMELFESSDIAKIEPKVVGGRKEEIVGVGARNDYSAVNFQQLSEAMASDAKQASGKNIEVRLNTKVLRIEPRDNGYDVITNEGTINTRFVVVSAGGHSLLFAQRMGFGLEFACLPVAGSFYYTPSVLNGKVYTVQNDKLPFAAIHGDPDVLVDGKTRFGPTALMLPMLERYNFGTMHEFFQVFGLDARAMAVLFDLFKVKDIRQYLLKNFLFEIPLIRRRLFLKDARKVVPTLQLSDLEFAKNVGGIRPVMIDKINRKLHLGEAKINPGNGIIFNMTPSPGATSCLFNAERDMRIISEHLGCNINESLLKQELK